MKNMRQKEKNWRDSSPFVLLALGFLAPPTTYGNSWAYTTAHRNAGILNPPSEARDQTRQLTVTSWIHFCCTAVGIPWKLYFNRKKQTINKKFSSDEKIMKSCNVTERDLTGVEEAWAWQCLLKWPNCLPKIRDNLCSLYDNSCFFAV